MYLSLYVCMYVCIYIYIYIYTYVYTHIHTTPCRPQCLHLSCRRDQCLRLYRPAPCSRTHLGSSQWGIILVHCHYRFVCIYSKAFALETWSTAPSSSQVPHATASGSTGLLKCNESSLLFIIVHHSFTYIPCCMMTLTYRVYASPRLCDTHSSSSSSSCTLAGCPGLQPDSWLPRSSDPCNGTYL